MGNTAKTIGENLRRIRTQRGLTQEELADRAEIDNSYLSYIEHGKRTPSIEILEKFAAVLHCTIQDIITPPIVRLIYKKKQLRFFVPKLLEV